MRSKDVGLCRKRKATWVAFAVVALAVCGGVAGETGRDSLESSLSDTKETVEPTIPTVIESVSEVDPDKKVEADTKAAEAEKALSDALEILKSLPRVPNYRSQWSLAPAKPKSLLGSLFPNHHGPIATALRIIGTLRQQSWLPRFMAKKIGGDKWGTKQQDSQRRRAQQAIQSLEHAAALGNADALYKLAQTLLFPPAALPMNAAKAFDKYQEHASLTGNGASHTMVGFFYSTGYGGVVPVDQAQALLYYTFGAIAGDQGAEMALAYRYWAGIGMSEDCMLALDWYESAAERSMAHFMSGPSGGRTLPHTPTKLSDLAGGVYGFGASMASTGPNAARPVIKASVARSLGESWEEVLEYWQYHADRGDAESCYRLGKIYYHGGIYNPIGGISAGAEGASALPIDYDAARTYFLKVTAKVWTRDTASKPESSKKSDIDEVDFYYAIHAASYLGRMHLRGEGVRPDVKLAKMWFDRAEKEGSKEGWAKESLNGLGIIYRDGLLEGKSREDYALVQFSRAAAQDLPDALVNTGKIYFNHGNLRLAKSHFDNAIRLGSQFEAYYYSAVISASLARAAAAKETAFGGSCSTAASFFKIVAERGRWKNDYITEAELLWKSGGEQEKEAAMLRWMIAADQGLEAAQNNIAYILDLDKRSPRGNWLNEPPSPTSNETAHTALLYWTRSAGQGDVDAMVKVGDYYYHGLGVEEPETLRKEKAAGYYQSAIETHSAVAMWNIGWMYENGVGVQQDFHLAKRHYDIALEFNSQAYLPVMLSLIKLHLRSLWYIIGGGRQPNLILWGDDGDEDHWWPTKLWRVEEELGPSTESEGESASQNKPKAPVPPAGILGEEDDDPVQRAREIREGQGYGDEDDEREPGEDYFDGMTIRRGNEDALDEADEEFWETIVLMFLLVGITGLMWLRGRYVARQEEEERRRRERAEEYQRRQQEVQQRAQNTRPQQAEGEVPEAPIAPAPGAQHHPQEALQPHMAMFM